MMKNIYPANDSRIRIDGAVLLQIRDGMSDDKFLSKLFDEKISLESSPEKIKIIPWRLPFPDIDLYSDKYSDNGDSKANRLRTIWQKDWSVWD